MADTWLTPGGSVDVLVSYCQIKTPTSTILADLAEDGEAAALLIEQRCGVILDRWAQDAIPRPLILAGLMVARQLWRARVGNQRAEGEPGVGVLWPAQAELLAWPYVLPGFA